MSLLFSLRYLTVIQFILLSSLSCFSSAIEEHKALVGALCSNADDCDSDLLYCSPEGVCLCDEQKANFVYEYRHHFSIREPICEVLPCTITKPMDKNECNLRHAECVAHAKGNETVGYCKCPGQMVGARRGTAFSLSQCKDIIQSSVGEKCISNLYICNIAKKLKCRDGMCECYDGHIFSFEEDICIRESEYYEKYGYDKLGTLGKYCSSSENCLSGMACKKKRCDCPYFCRSGEYIKDDELCYCAFDMTKLAYIIPSIVISILFVLFFFGLYYYNKKYEESLHAQSDLVLVHGRKTPNNAGPPFLFKEGGKFSPLASVPLSPEQPPVACSYTPSISRSPQNQCYQDPNWSPDETPQQLSGLDLSVQANCGSYSFYPPPPPYQLNEMVAAEMVEAQMRQDSPSTVQYMEPN